MANNQNEEATTSPGLSWSDTEYELSEFLDIFTLPQIVQVAEGNYGVSEETTLPAGQILTLHVVKQTKMYRGYTYEGAEVLLPLNCPEKVEVRPQNVSLMYNTVKELCTALQRIKYVRVTKDHFDPSAPERCIKAGQRLKIEYLSKQHKGKPLLMCLDEEGCELCLTMDTVGGFQPLMNNREYFLMELPEHFPLPLYVQFTSPPNFHVSGDIASKLDSKLLAGMIQVDEMVIDSTVIASTKEDGNKTILTFPRTLDVSLIVSEQALANDSTYARICETLNDGVDLVKLQTVACPENVVYGTRRQLIRELSFNQFGTIQPPQDPLPANDIVYEEDEDGYIDIDSLTYVEIDTVFTKPATEISHEKEQQTEDEVCTPSGEEIYDTGVEVREDYQCMEQSPESPQDKKYRPPVARRDRKQYVRSMTIAGVVELLKSLNLEQYSEIFEREQVDGRILQDLDKAILQKHFNMTPFHALKLAKATEENWRPKKGQK